MLLFNSSFSDKNMAIILPRQLSYDNTCVTGVAQRVATVAGLFLSSTMTCGNICCYEHNIIKSAQYAHLHTVKNQQVQLSKTQRMNLIT